MVKKAVADSPPSDSEIEVEEDGLDAQPDIEEPELGGEGDDDEGLSDSKEDELEDDDQPEEASDLEALSSPPPEETPIPQPRLKIKLKLPPQTSASSSMAATAASTPVGTSRVPSRRAASRDIDIESEDSESGDDAHSTRSMSAGTTAPGRALTARQAVLANVVDSSHVSLIEPPNPRKKKPLTELELALKREETARKRRNLSEKKLEDEKAETINRLLKKQSRSKNKRNALSTAEDRPTPLASVSNYVDAEAEEAIGEGTVASTPIVPTMYRWISTTRPQGTLLSKPETERDEDGPRMMMSFSVPVIAMPQQENADRMDVDDSNKILEIDRPAPRQPQLCDVDGCGVQRRYRLVKDWTRGACGINHLKVLEAQIGNA